MKLRQNLTSVTFPVDGIINSIDSVSIRSILLTHPWLFLDVAERIQRTAEVRLPSLMIRFLFARVVLPWTIQEEKGK